MTIPSNDDGTTSVVSTINVYEQVVAIDGATRVNQVVAAVESSITLPNSDTPVAGTFSLFKNGLRLVPTTDFTLAGSVVTLLVAPVATDVFVADYYVLIP